MEAGGGAGACGAGVAVVALALSAAGDRVEFALTGGRSGSVRVAALEGEGVVGVWDGGFAGSVCCLAAAALSGGGGDGGGAEVRADAGGALLVCLR